MKPVDAATRRPIWTPMALILTLGFDDASFVRFDAARRRHFPPARNFIPAHLTLFQQLPDAAAPALARHLGCTARRTPPLPFDVTGILDFGGGAAFDLAMPGYRPLLDRLRSAWKGHITPSDDRARKPHVTVQNKVSRDRALETQKVLRAEFTAWSGTGDRLLLWRYRGGPWDALGAWRLTAPEDAPGIAPQGPLD